MKASMSEALTAGAVGSVMLAGVGRTMGGLDGVVDGRAVLGSALGTMEDLLKIVLLASMLRLSNMTRAVSLHIG